MTFGRHGEVSASGMESTCIVGRIQVGPNIAASLHGQFVLIDRGEIEVRGKGSMRTWFLGRPGFLGELAGLKRYSESPIPYRPFQACRDRRRRTPWCIPIPASGSSPRPLSVAEPRRITRINTDAGDGVAYLLLPRLTLVPVFQRALAGSLCRSARWDRSALVCACAPIVNASVIATMSAVRISARFPVLSTVE